ncbi:hypothetical protein IEQ34_022940 [Dendrobium chrysotoxum]|uniref:Uncharacterized protein n=1 Tax=Dendrobium chrysotoxum TaxID=161865 RepID=A0AAV7FYV1_DENCH|nr:hypothetical protein IEQ34_022940 [Dendrobium chrysotoxum]
MGDPTSTKNLSPKGDRFVARREGIKKIYKATKTDDVVSTVTGDALLAFRKKYYFPNDMAVKVPARSDRACSPPLGFVTVYEFSLRAGLRFPPSPELSDILMICGVSLAQLSYRAMSIIMGLIVLFRDRGAVLSPDCLARMGRLIGDTQGRISFRSKWLDIRTQDPSKSWISDFFYVKNDWNLLEKWGKMRELPIPIHLGAEELLKILKFSDIDTLHYEVRYLSRYIDEEYLFKVGLSTQAGRSHAQMLKKSVKVSEAAVQSSKIPPKRPGSEDNVQTVKKKRVEEVLAVTSKDPLISPSKSHIPEDVLKHQCVGCRHTEELSAQMTKALNDWNDEFVKIKYLQGEYKKKHDGKLKEMQVVEQLLAECRTELANMMTSASIQNQKIDCLHIELVDAQTTMNQQMKDQEILVAENKRLQSMLSERETQQPPSIIIDDFKKSAAFKIIVEDHIQEARNHIYDVEVKALEADCMEEGFIRGFMKGVRAVQRKTVAEIDGLTPSQASDSNVEDFVLYLLQEILLVLISVIHDVEHCEGAQQHAVGLTQQGGPKEREVADLYVKDE